MTTQFITGLLIGGLIGAALTVFIIALCNVTQHPPMPTCGVSIPMPLVKPPRTDQPLRAGEHLRAFSELEIRDDKAYEIPPLDVWPSRLANLVCWSGVFADKQPWLGTAAELRIALIAPTSRLNWRNQRELPAAAAIEARLTGMLHSHGRITVERVGYNAAGQTMWSLNLAQQAETASC